MAGLQKKVVVIDIGHKYTKLGIGGDSHPRFIIPTSFWDNKHGKWKSVHNYKKKDELYNNFVEFLHYLYFKKILISPKDTKVIIIDSLISSIQEREVLAKVLFCHFQIASLLMLPSHVVSLYTLAVKTALVVDIGYKEACVIPVYEGYPVLHAYESYPVAGQAVENNLRNLLIEHYKQKDDSVLVEIVQNLPEKIIEDIKVKMCFVTSFDRSVKLQSEENGSAPPCVDYNLAGTGYINISGTIRETAFEVLFHLDGDKISLTTMILNSLVKCPMDMRKSLANNILLIGGTAAIAGLKSRLLRELQYFVKSSLYENKLFIDYFKMHSSPSVENYTAWLGGSLIAVTEMVNLCSVSKENYKSEKDIPDWANLKYNRKQDGSTAK